MLKYASKLLLDIFLSVLATVVGAYLANHYVAGTSIAKAPIPVADTAVDPKGAGNAVSREVAQMEATASEVSLGVVSTIGPVASASGRTAEHANDEKTVPPTTKLAEPTCVPTRHLPAPHDKRVSKTSATATLLIPSKIGAAPEPARTTTERMLSLSANSSVDAPPYPQEVERENDRSPPLDPEMESSHLGRRVLKPIIRTALLLLESSSLVDRANAPQRRTSPDETRSPSRVVEPEFTERSLSGRTWLLDPFSRRPETQRQANGPEKAAFEQGF
jgi:hypothetical protein